MKYYKYLLSILVLFTLSPYTFSCNSDGLSGIVEENDLWIGVEQKENSNITKKQFNAIIDRALEIYSPIIAEKGGEFVVERNWDDGTVNAYAQQNGNVWSVSMFGGLARHETITPDAFALVVCHEIGHHIGGIPKKSGWWGSNWASNEGQADYFGTMKCFRKMYENEDNITITASMMIDPFAKEACLNNFTGPSDIALCERASMAGLGLGNLFRSLRNLGRDLKFTTPDPSIVTQTDHNHPAPQCRLDTYFAGAVCNRDHHIDVSNEDYNIGVCNRNDRDSFGLRPLCWYHPES